MENDICHICLENIDFLTINLIKDCCDAFICNPCWLRLKNDSDINDCPICKEDIRTYCESSTQTNTYSETPRNSGRCIETKEKFRKLCMILKWTMTGYLLTLLILLIIRINELHKIKEDIQFINRHLYFWPICISYGFLIVIMFEELCNCPCQRWYRGV